MPVDVMKKLGLQGVRHINAEMANGQTQSVEMTEGVDVEIMDRLVTEAFLVLGGEVLVGQTALESTDLLVDCNRQKVIANPAHPNSCNHSHSVSVYGTHTGGLEKRRADACGIDPLVQFTIVR